MTGPPLRWAGDVRRGARRAGLVGTASEVVIAMCTQQSHADLKRDANRWAAEVDPIGEIDVGDGSIVVLANCRRCHSTLAVERMQEARGGAPRAR